MNLNKLIDDLEKSAAEVKPATEQATEKPLISQELDKVLTKEAAATNAKAAFDEGASIARQVLEKLATEAVVVPAPEVEKTASEVLVTEPTGDVTVTPVEAATEVTTETVSEQTEDDMDKKAQEERLAAANEIVKLANRIIAEEAHLVAQHDKRIGPTPGLNGTVNNVFDAIVAKAKSLGPVGVDQGSGAAPSSSAEARDPAMGTPSIPPSPDVTVKSASEEMQEKQAAVNALVEAGLEWDVAVDLVKAAAEELAEEELGQTKVAAVSQLMSEGFNFDDAVAAVQAATAPEQA